MSASFGLALFLSAINLLVVCGNLFVLYILVSQKSLHTSTNTIVFSLTLSDFLLGCLVLPFSIIQEFSHNWSFGTVWCKSWLSLDILFSTASIYNLLAISFDRYMAVKQPIKYGRLISSSRLTKFTISAVWVISAFLAIPPFLSDLFLITDSKEQMEDLLGTNYSDAFLEFAGTCTPVTNSDLYILFSATISFILPMILMVGLNASIFCTVLDSKRKLSQATSSTFPGRKTSALFGGGGSKYGTASCDDMDRILRVHRGGSSRIQPPPSSASSCLSETHLIASVKCRRSLNLLKKASLGRRDFYQPFSLPMPKTITPYDRQSLPASRKPTTESNAAQNGSLTNGCVGIGMASKSVDAGLSFSLESPPTMPRNHCLTWHAPKGARLVWINRIRRIKMSHHHQKQHQKRSYHSMFGSSTSPTFDHHPLQLPAQMALNMRRLLEQERLVRSMPAVRQPSIIERTADRSVWFPAVVTSLFIGGQKRSATICRRQSERLLLYPTLQFAKTSLRTELRVARTIAVVVGCFTCCWFPFTIIYVLQAFQLCPVGQCIPDWLFTLAFWLGYSNSAFNPILYAAFSRDFRIAFRKILMRDRSSSLRSSA